MAFQPNGTYTVWADQLPIGSYQRFASARKHGRAHGEVHPTMRICVTQHGQVVWVLTRSEENGNAKV